MCADYRGGAPSVKSTEGFWSGKLALVTGGASFIGSTLTDQLLARGAMVRIVDDLSSGHLDNIRGHLGGGHVDFLHADLREPGVARAAMHGVDTLFHLAADHGGRGYVDLHQAGPASNFLLDGLVFAEALQAYAKEHGMGAASCRYFTVYGPRGVENHAVIAMIARAFLGQDPFEIWGDGSQIRNWTYIDDIVGGTILAGEKINDGTAINLGTMERITVLECAKLVGEMTGHKAEIKRRPDMPTGPLNRVADNALAKRLLGWEPKTLFRQGLKKTIDWYYANKDRN